MFKAPSTSDNAAQELRELPLEAIVPNPAQPRRCFDEEALQELAGSLGECGVLQPVLVRSLKDGKYELLAGERRWRASKIAGLQSIPALVSRYDNLAALEVGLIENMARADLNPVEEARACATLVDELGLTQGQIGRGVGRSRGMVNSLIGLLRLSEEILELLERGELSFTHGVALLGVEDPDARLPLARAAIEREWTVRTLERRTRASKASEQVLDQGQVRDLAALNVARAWGDLLGTEVHVRVLPRGQMRMEVVFDSAAEGIALADRLAAAITRGSKGSR